MERLERTRTELFGVVEDGPVLRVDPHVGSGRWVLEGRVEDLPVGTAVLADITGERTADPSDEWDDPNLFAAPGSVWVTGLTYGAPTGATNAAGDINRCLAGFASSLPDATLRSDNRFRAALRR